MRTRKWSLGLRMIESCSLTIQRVKISSGNTSTLKWLRTARHCSLADTFSGGCQQRPSPAFARSWKYSLFQRVWKFSKLTRLYGPPRDRIIRFSARAYYRGTKIQYFPSFYIQLTRIALVCGSSFPRMIVSQPATRNSLPRPCNILSTTNLIWDGRRISCETLKIKDDASFNSVFLSNVLEYHPLMEEDRYLYSRNFHQSVEQ